MTKYFLQRLRVVSLKDDDGAVGGEGEGVGDGGVEGALPPRGERGAVEGPLEACGGDVGTRVEGEEGDLLSFKS